MASFFYKKQPGEAWLIAVDFITLRLESAENIESFAVTATKQSDDSDATDDIINGVPTEAQGIVSIPVENGVDGERYTITTKVTTDSTPASKYEEDVVVEVTNTP